MAREIRCCDEKHGNRNEPYHFTIPSTRGFPAAKLRIEFAFERRRCLGALDYDQIIVLPLKAGRGKVRGAGAQQSPVDLVALEVHWGAGCLLRRRCVCVAKTKSGRIGDEVRRGLRVI